MKTRWNMCYSEKCGHFGRKCWIVAKNKAPLSYRFDILYSDLLEGQDQKHLVVSYDNEITFMDTEKPLYFVMRTFRNFQYVPVSDDLPF